MTGGHLRILVVEDDPETACQFMEQLTTSGYQMDLASSGNEAPSHGPAHDYAVITIDRMLRGIDGIGVLVPPTLLVSADELIE
jgi:two-component system OmpR family response regulator